MDSWKVRLCNMPGILQTSTVLPESGLPSKIVMSMPKKRRGFSHIFLLVPIWCPRCQEVDDIIDTQKVVSSIFIPPPSGIKLSEDSISARRVFGCPYGTGTYLSLGISQTRQNSDSLIVCCWVSFVPPYVFGRPRAWRRLSFGYWGRKRRNRKEKLTMNWVFVLVS